jgi:DNA polymerase III delta prime subunit
MEFEQEQSKLLINDYCPKTLDDIIGQDNIVDLINSYNKIDYIPNMIITGTHGVGKSSIANIIINNHLSDMKKFACLKIIGSIYRGKDIITENLNKKQSSKTDQYPNIIKFIKKTMNLPENKTRIILIYDFDCMTIDAQMALRRIMETYSNKVRFIFLCNNLNNIIEAIQSRATIINLTVISHDDIIFKLKQIINNINKSNVKLLIEDQILNHITTIANGDLRNAINMLQIFMNSENKTLEEFYQIFNVPSIEIITSIIKYCISNNYQSAIIELDKLINDGFNIFDITDILIKVIKIPNLFNKKSEHIRAYYINEIIKFNIIIQETSEIIHLYNLIGTLSTYKSN